MIRLLPAQVCGVWRARQLPPPPADYPLHCEIDDETKASSDGGYTSGKSSLSWASQGAISKYI